MGTTGSDGYRNNWCRWKWGQLVQMGMGTTGVGGSGDNRSRWVWGQLAGSQRPFPCMKHAVQATSEPADLHCTSQTLL